MSELYWGMKYNIDFVKHCNYHLHTPEEKRLNNVIIQNFAKSIFLSNSLAIYINYIRKNKSLIKAICSKIK